MYKGIPKDTDMTDKEYTFDGKMEKACEVQCPTKKETSAAWRQECERLQDIIDLQANEISAYTKTNVELICERDMLAEQLGSLRKNLHEECASSAKTIRALQEQLKARQGDLWVARQSEDQLEKECQVW